MDLGTFYETYKQEYCRKLLRCMNGRGLSCHAEDIIHDVVVNLVADEKKRVHFESLTEIRQMRYFSACLRNRLIDILRREKRQREYLDLLGCQAKEEQIRVLDVETLVLDRMEFETRMIRTARMLCAEERRLLYFVFMKEISYREFARKSQIRQGTVAMRVLRLRGKLQKLRDAEKQRETEKSA